MLQEDESLHCSGETLVQEEPIAYASNTLTDPEARYSHFERGMLAKVFSLECFHHYMYGRHVIVETNNKHLVQY